MSVMNSSRLTSAPLPTWQPLKNLKTAYANGLTYPSTLFAYPNLRDVLLSSPRDVIHAAQAHATTFPYFSPSARTRAYKNIKVAAQHFGVSDRIPQQEPPSEYERYGIRQDDNNEYENGQLDAMARENQHQRTSLLKRARSAGVGIPVSAFRGVVGAERTPEDDRREELRRRINTIRYIGAAKNQRTIPGLVETRSALYEQREEKAIRKAYEKMNPEKFKRRRMLKDLLGKEPERENRFDYLLRKK